MTTVDKAKSQQENDAYWAERLSEEARLRQEAEAKLPDHDGTKPCKDDPR